MVEFNFGYDYVHIYSTLLPFIYIKKAMINILIIHNIISYKIKIGLLLYA